MRLHYQKNMTVEQIAEVYDVETKRIKAVLKKRDHEKAQFMKKK